MSHAIYLYTADALFLSRIDFFRKSSTPVASVRKRLLRIMNMLVCATVVFICANSVFSAAAHAEEGKDDIIIEKNLFSSERKKWVSEPVVNKLSAEKMAKKEINELMLLGTVISKENRYAVLRTKKDAGKEGFKPSMKGDYIQGYLVKEIEEKKVTLQDEAENTEYVLYINDDKKERVAEKTELKPEPPKAVVEDKKTAQPAQKRKNRRSAKQPPIPADAPEAVKRAMEKNLEQEKSPPPPDLPDTVKKAIEQAEAQEE